MALHLITGHKGEAHISPIDIGAFNAGTFGSGEYVLNNGNKFAIETIDNNNLKILDGDVMMQGRHITLKSGTYEQITINNGESGMKRNDLIVIRYTKNEQTGAENVVLAVVQGEPTSGTPTDPELTTGDILSGNCLLHEMPLYRIQVTDYVVGTPEPLFKTCTATANRIIAGTYRGDGNPSQFIDLGFTPDAVYVSRTDGLATSANNNGGYGLQHYGGLALRNSDCRLWHQNKDYPIVKIVENGFNVYFDDSTGPVSNSSAWDIYANKSSTWFNYIAFNLSGGGV